MLDFGNIPKDKRLPSNMIIAEYTEHFLKAHIFYKALLFPQLIVQFISFRLTIIITYIYIYIYIVTYHYYSHHSRPGTDRVQRERF